MGLFERYLMLWVGLAMAAGVLFGLWQPELVEQVAALQWAKVNFVVAVLIWLMIYPMMLKIDLASIKEVRKAPAALALTLVVNWIIKPLSMAGIGILFFEHIFADLVPFEDGQAYIAGMILLGVAPCTAMVFVWSHLTKGDPNYTLVQVSVNDLILVFAFAPLSAALLGSAQIEVPWDTLITSVLIFVVVPLIAGAVTRWRLLDGADERRVDRLGETLKGSSIAGLLLIVVILFSFQAQTIVENPLPVLLIAVPLLIQSYGIFAVSYGIAYALRIPFNKAAPCAMIGTSNFFELAVAVAITLFGLHSGAALATVVGVLIEVPVMLSLVAFANASQTWFDARSKPHGQGPG